MKSLSIQENVSAFYLNIVPFNFFVNNFVHLNLLVVKIYILRSLSTMIKYFCLNKSRSFPMRWSAYVKIGVIVNVLLSGTMHLRWARHLS